MKEKEMTKSEKNDKSLQALRTYIKEKRVLDVGCVGQVEKFARHEYIKKQNPSFILGIDIVESSKDNTEVCDISDENDAKYLSE